MNTEYWDNYFREKEDAYILRASRDFKMDKRPQTVNNADLADRAIVAALKSVQKDPLKASAFIRMMSKLPNYNSQSPFMDDVPVNGEMLEPVLTVLEKLGPKIYTAVDLFLKYVKMDLASRKRILQVLSQKASRDFANESVRVIIPFLDSLENVPNLFTRAVEFLSAQPIERVNYARVLEFKEAISEKDKIRKLLFEAGLLAKESGNLIPREVARNIVFRAEFRNLCENDDDISNLIKVIILAEYLGIIVSPRMSKRQVCNEIVSVLQNQIQRK